MTESVPKSRSEVFFAKFQQASINSALAGRSFLNLCSLMDLQLSGKVSKDELLTICKMMDCPMSLADLERMFEYLPGNVVSIDGKKVDYRMLQSYLQSFNIQTQTVLPNNMNNFNNTANPHMGNNNMNMNMSMNMGTMRTGALPVYATPHHNTFTSMDVLPGSMLNKSITTPLGFTINTPFQQQQHNMMNTSSFMPNQSMMQMPASGGAYDQIFKQLKERVRRACEEKTRLTGHTYNLRRKCEQLDGLNAGTIHMYTLQRIMEDLGILLNPSEISTIYGLYGRVGEENVYYDSLCRALETSSISLNVNDMQVTYLSEKVLSRLRDLRQHGRNPRDMFEAYDLDRTGLMSAVKFQEIVQKLQLFSTEHQLIKAIEDFSTIGNRSTVNYEEFCDALERAAMTLPVVYSMNDSMQRSRVGIADGDGYDGFTPRQDLQETRDRFRMSNSIVRNRGGMSLDMEEDVPLSGRDSYYQQPLSPPRVTDSAAFARSSQRFGNTSPTRGSGGVNLSSSLQIPRTSPSKVGSKMWGSQTPMARKGETLHVGRSKWCCPVCLYIENAISSEFCAVCDSPNYAVNKVGKY
ncbi:hypothetical protein EON65_22380 [archaeon]|nr:MAG: hypothetical protein EON65_22380 [archaeon]